VWCQVTSGQLASRCWHLHMACIDPSTPSPLQDAARPEGGEPSEPGPHSGQLLLLKGITFRPGVLTALMGASGAGKTVSRHRLGGRSWTDCSAHTAQPHELSRSQSRIRHR
jgi:hypothetical protein